ncbi:hypothetical protein JG687_00015894 [Phytophthora cactorum]|uniref:Uncharacterized protein n=1 Tax=Phytophthora cactorum TaxID=29920 RepID=A0A8T1TS38_9STRA|nr:hypothetical protein JG687_00015894 [Phytophthora cactorum]
MTQGLCVRHVDVLISRESRRTNNNIKNERFIRLEIFRWWYVTIDRRGIRYRSALVHSKPHFEIRSELASPPRSFFFQFGMQLHHVLLVAAIRVQGLSASKSNPKTSKLNGWYPCSEYTFSGQGVLPYSVPLCYPGVCEAPEWVDQIGDTFVKRLPSADPMPATNVWLLQGGPGFASKNRELLTVPNQPSHPIKVLIYENIFCPKMRPKMGLEYGVVIYQKILISNQFVSYT